MVNWVIKYGMSKHEPKWLLDAWEQCIGFPKMLPADNWFKWTYWVGFFPSFGNDTSRLFSELGWMEKMWLVITCNTYLIVYKKCRPPLEKSVFVSASLVISIFFPLLTTAWAIKYRGVSEVNNNILRSSKAMLIWSILRKYTPFTYFFLCDFQ